MAYTAEHAYLTFGGSQPGGEIWQTGIRYQKYSVPTGTWADAFAGIGLADIYDDIATWFADGDVGINQYTTLRWAKLASIGTDGSYTLDPRIHEAGSPTAGGSSTTAFPNQVCQVYSLRTGTEIGKANYGKMYVPTGALGFGADTRVFSSLTQTAKAAKFKTMFNAVAGEMDSIIQPLRPAIFSTAGVTRPITEFNLGNVPDTQRRRRGAMVETRTSDTF